MGTQTNKETERQRIRERGHTVRRQPLTGCRRPQSHTATQLTEGRPPDTAVRPARACSVGFTFSPQNLALSHLLPQQHCRTYWLEATDTPTDTQKDTQADRHTNTRGTDTQKDTQADRHTNTRAQTHRLTDK